MNDQIESAAAEWLVRRDHGLNVEQAQQFERWMQQPEHAAALARHEQAWRFVGGPLQRGSGPKMAEEIRRWSRRRQRLLTAGGVLGAVVVGLLVLRPFHRTSTREEFPTAVVVAPEVRRLTDGSTATLRPGAEIAVDFAAEGTGPRRISLRRGEVLFSVLARKERPFIVEAGTVEVRVLGTTFAVRRTDAEVEVLVTEGRVVLERASQPLAAQTLGPGENAVVTRDENGPARVTTLDAPAVSDRLSWQSVRLEFSSTPLAEAIRLLNRHGPTRFEIEDPAVASIEVSGFFKADNSEAFIRILAEGAGIVAERRGGKIVLRKAP